MNFLSKGDCITWELMKAGAQYRQLINDIGDVIQKVVVNMRDNGKF